MSGKLQSKGTVAVTLRHYGIATDGAPTVNSKESVDAVLEAMRQQHGVELKALVVRAVRVQPNLRDVWHVLEPPELYCRAIEM